MENISPELLAIVPCVSDFLDLDGSELLAATSISTDISDDTTLMAALLLNPSNSSDSGKENCTDSHASFISVASLSDYEFQQAFRMQEATFWQLLSILKEHESETNKTTKVKKNDLTLDNNVLMTLHYLGSQKKRRDISEMFHTKESDAWNSIRTTISSLYDLMQHFISWPTDTEKERITGGFEAICKLPNVLGAIGATHLECTAGSHVNNSLYTDASGKPSIILQAVCDHQMKFLHCCTGWPGTLDNISVLHGSDLFQDVLKDCSSYFLDDSVLIGDQDYPLHTWLITPFVKEAGYLNDHETHFNFCHSLAVNVISKTFLHLKRRFPRLNCLDTNNLEYLVKTVLVACALHNLCINQDEDTLFTDYNNDESLQKSTKESSIRNEEKISVQNGSSMSEKLANDVRSSLMKQLVKSIIKTSL